ncbi:MAG: VanW family protein [Syntrophomonadaceae bacterium]
MKPKRIIIPLIILCQFAINTVIGAAWVIPDNPQVIPDGILVNGFDVGGLTRDQAVVYLGQKVSNAKIDEKITLYDGNKRWVLMTRDYEFVYDFSKTVDTALTVANNGGGSEKALNIIKLQAKSVNLPMEISYDQEKLKNSLDLINEQVRTPAQDAGLDYGNSSLSITEEKAGQELDIELMTSRIQDYIKARASGELPLPKKVVQPRVVKADLVNVNSRLAVFSTTMAGSSASRSNNIDLAARMLDNTVVLPGETFSFNDRVGQRSKEKGYTEAPTISGKNLTLDLGGGVCQVATTLYNTVLQNALPIVEHFNHTIPGKSIPNARDATVAYNQLDLKFKNNLSNPVVIHSYLNNNSVIVELYGNASDKKKA